jgi:hypothetical protein
MGHAAAPTIELPDQDRLEPLEAGIPKELKPRAAGGGSAKARIYIFLKDLPTLLGHVFSKGVELHVATLVCCAHSGVYGDDHGL